MLHIQHKQAHMENRYMSIPNDEYVTSEQLYEMFREGFPDASEKELSAIIAQFIEESQ